MSDLTEIKRFDALPGSDINEVTKEAREIAIKNNCIVEFDFNGVLMRVYYFSSIEEEVNYYGRRLREKK